MTTPFISNLPLLLLVLVYLLSMYFLVRLFYKTFRIIRQKKVNGLEFYRKLVAISIIVTMVDATYTIGVRILYLFYPLQDYIYYGIAPIVVKTLVLFCIWGFYSIQMGGTLHCLSCKYWFDKIKSFFSKKK